jgi:hypothetical protein
MATEEIGFKLSVEEGNSKQTVKSFKAELKEANENLIRISREFGELSPQARAAATAVGKLKEEMADAAELTKAVTDEKRFAAFAGLAGSIAGGFSAAQGAITLATGESKEFEKAMLKVQAAMALSQGLTQVAEIGRMWGVARASLMSFSVVQKANTAATAAAATIQKIFSGSVDTSSKSFTILKGAIAATGIGLLIVAIGYVVTNFQKLKETLYNLLPFLETVEKIIGTIVDAVTDFVGITSDATRAADALRASIEEQNSVNEKTITLLEAQGTKAKEVRKIKAEMYQSEIDKLLQIQKLGQTLSEDETKRLDELKFKRAILNAEQAKEDRDAAEEARKKAEEEAKKAKEKADADKKKRDEEKKKEAEELAKQLKEAIQKNIDAQKTQHAHELELAKIRKEDTVALRKQQIEEEIALLSISGKEYNDKIVELKREEVILAAQAEAEEKEKIAEAKKEQEEKEKEIAQQLKEDADAAREESLATDLLRLQEKYDAMRAVVGTNEALLTQITDAESAARTAVQKKWDDIAVENKRTQAGQLAGILSSVSNLVGKQTVIGKGLAVAEATISTYLGASKALAGVSTANPFGAAMAIANAATIIATGLVNVHKIVTTKVPNASDNISAPSAASTAATSPAVSTAPTMDGIQSTIISQQKQISEGKEPFKAYVVESEITEKQERQRAIQQTANF